MSRIYAIFESEGNAREALCKLQALRASTVDHGADGASLTVSVADEIDERALRLIRQSGGTPEL